MSPLPVANGTLGSMYDDQSTPIPASFLTLHAGAHSRLITPLAEVRQRYDLCEDLAVQLQASAQALQHDDGLTPEDVLAGIRVALGRSESGLAAGESVWVVRRLAELLSWGDPGPG